MRLVNLALGLVLFIVVVDFAHHRFGAADVLTAEIICQRTAPNCVRIKTAEVYQAVPLRANADGFTIQNITGGEDGSDPGANCFIALPNREFDLAEGANLHTTATVNGMPITGQQGSIVLPRLGIYQRFSSETTKVLAACDKAGPSLVVGVTCLGKC